MKNVMLAAAAVSFAMPAVAQDGPPRGGPPPAVISQSNLARAGVLPLMYGEREYGLLQTRSGESRSRIGNASGPGGPAGDYMHEGTAIVAPVFLRYGIPGTTKYVMGRVTGSLKNEAANTTQSDSTNLLGWVGFQNFYSPNAMWGVQLGFTNLDSEGEATKVSRDSLNLRFDYARILSDNWGFAGKAYASFGENTVRIKGPGITYTQEEDQVYIQGELVGNFTNKDLSAVPAGWAFRPVLGMNYQRYFLTETTNSVGGIEEGGTRDVGTVWAKATFAKLTKPGQWSPNVTIGLEHAFKDDYSAFIDEDTHAILGVGASVLIPGGGNTISVGLDHREGLNGKRSNTQLTTVFNFTF